MLYTKFLFITCLSLGTYIGCAQNRLPAFEMNARLGRGINMGNSFEAPSESAWGNPWKPEYFKIIAQLGFKHVRLPVRWEPADRSMATAPYTINQVFMNRIQQVVDSAFKYNLHIIINMHHHDALYENPSAQKARFLSQWFQIANHFKNYPDKLLFEVLNEPHGNITPALWNEYFADALAEIRKTNPTRVVIMGVAEYGGLGGIAKLLPPKDDYIILSPHYYNPFNFTHQGAEWVGGSDAWLGTKWHDTEADRQTVLSEFSYALQFSEKNHIPIHVGEFGVYNKADSESRKRWTNFLARWFEENNVSWAYWEFSAGFGIYNPTSKAFVPELTDALLHNAMAAPIPIVAVPIYTSNFSGGSDGWTLAKQGDAQGSLTTAGTKLNIQLTNGGTESWHVQLIKNNIPLHKDKLYRISFKAVATGERSSTVYAGKASDPWNSYSGYRGISMGTVEQAFTQSFTMSNATDLSARLVFDLGKSTVGASISEVKVEELVPVITDIEKENNQSKVMVYPNPVHSVLQIKEPEKYQHAELFDLKGQSWVAFEINSNTHQINLEKIPAGLYILRLTGSGFDHRIKIIKE